MEAVREEVTQLMLEGVQKTASYCASVCAERIVAARRDMQRRFAEERREMERLYGVGSRAAASSPVTVPLDLFAPWKNEAATFSPAPSVIAGAGLAAFTSSLVAGLDDARPDASPYNLLDDLASAAAYDVAFVDAYDAVQTLEERTNMASRAMDLLDEALQTAVDLTTDARAASEHSSSPRNTPAARNQVSTPTGGPMPLRSLIHSRLAAMPGTPPRRVDLGPSLGLGAAAPSPRSPGSPASARQGSSRRERSVASMSSGISSIPAADLHGA